jgi:hypothetical protein
MPPELLCGLDKNLVLVVGQQSDHWWLFRGCAYFFIAPFAVVKIGVKRLLPSFRALCEDLDRNLGREHVNEWTYDLHFLTPHNWQQESI